MVETMSGNIIIDCQFKTRDGWISRVKFLQEIKSKEALMAKSYAQLKMKDINILHDELGHPLDVIIQATGQAI